MKNQKKAYLLALATVGLWSTIASASKLTLSYLSPEQLLFYSCIVSLCVLFGIIVVQGKVVLLRQVNGRQLAACIGFGFLNPFTYYLVLFKAYSLLPAQQAQIINYTWAITLTLLSIPILKQKVSKGQWLAIFICYCGVLVIATKGRLLELQFENPLGVGFALLSTIIWALYWIFNTRDTLDPVVSLFLNFLCGLPMIGLYLFWVGGFTPVPINGVLGAAYIGTFEMGVSFVLWLSALKLSESTGKIANLIFLSPLLSLFFIHFLVGEEILISTLIGLALVISGLMVQALSARKSG